MAWLPAVLVMSMLCWPGPCQLWGLPLQGAARAPLHAAEVRAQSVPHRGTRSTLMYVLGAELSCAFVTVCPVLPAAPSRTSQSHTAQEAQLFHGSAGPVPTVHASTWHRRQGSSPATISWPSGPVQQLQHLQKAPATHSRRHRLYQQVLVHWTGRIPGRTRSWVGWSAGRRISPQARTALHHALTTSGHDGIDSHKFTTRSQCWVPSRRSAQAAARDTSAQQALQLDFWQLALCSNCCQVAVGIAGVWHAWCIWWDCLV